MLTAGLDNLLAESFRFTIQDNLGDKTYKKIENALQESYGITVLDAIKDFGKMEKILKKIFGSNENVIVEDFLKTFLSITSSNKNKSWITIHDEFLAKSILESYVDIDKRRVLDNSMREPYLIIDIIKNCNLPKSTGYRIIRELADQGLLTEQGFSATNDGRKQYRYVSLFDGIKADIQGDKTILKVQINKDFLKESRILQATSNSLLF